MDAEAGGAIQRGDEVLRVVLDNALLVVGAIHRGEFDVALAAADGALQRDGNFSAPRFLTCSTSLTASPNVAESLAELEVGGWNRIPSAPLEVTPA